MVQCEIVWYFEYVIVGEYDFCVLVELCCGQFEIVVYCECCEFDVCVIQIVEEICECEQWDEVLCGFVYCMLFD